jgi:predicted transcriptional regulator
MAVESSPPEQDAAMDWVSSRIDADLKARLEKLAEAGDRTVSAEIRRAIRFYVEAEEAASEAA